MSRHTLFSVIVSATAGMCSGAISNSLFGNVPWLISLSIAAVAILVGGLSAYIVVRPIWPKQ